MMFLNKKNQMGETARIVWPIAGLDSMVGCVGSDDHVLYARHLLGVRIELSFVGIKS